jgi:lipopolysaccharide/colanic/teichoic acid biosynthesis glycosyltransferase
MDDRFGSGIRDQGSGIRDQEAASRKPQAASRKPQFVIRRLSSVVRRPSSVVGPTLHIDTTDPAAILPAATLVASLGVARVRVVIGPPTVGVATPALLALCNGPVPVEVVPWLWAAGTHAPPGVGYRAAKRLLDLLVGGLLLVVAAPLLALLALLIRLESPGPAFYRQPRVGRHGRRFAMYKLRTMRSGADAQLHELVRPLAVGDPRPGPRFVYKLPDDPRITRVGRLLRKTSLDELPQLLNVLRGEMSLVGPRPELPEVLAHYPAAQLAWLALPPGLTGWWQVNGRSIHPRHLSTDYDLYYLRHASLAFDLRILARTLGAVLRGTGAF